MSNIYLKAQNQKISLVECTVYFTTKFYISLLFDTFHEFPGASTPLSWAKPRPVCHYFLLTSETNICILLSQYPIHFLKFSKQFSVTVRKLLQNVKNDELSCEISSFPKVHISIPEVFYITVALFGVYCIHLQYPSWAILHLKSLSLF